MVFASVFTRLGSDQAILTQQQQAIINQQAIILVGYMYLYNKSDMQWFIQQFKSTIANQPLSLVTLTLTWEPPSVMMLLSESWCSHW